QVAHRGTPGMVSSGRSPGGDLGQEPRPLPLGTRTLRTRMRPAGGPNPPVWLQAKGAMRWAGGYCVGQTPGIALRVGACWYEANQEMCCDCTCWLFAGETSTYTCYCHPQRAARAQTGAVSISQTRIA